VAEDLSRIIRFDTWEEFTDLCKKFDLRIEERIPLDTLIPFWLNFLPSKIAATLFPLIYRADLLLAKFIPPGRYLVKLSQFSSTNQRTSSKVRRADNEVFSRQYGPIVKEDQRSPARKRRSTTRDIKRPFQRRVDGTRR